MNSSEIHRKTPPSNNVDFRLLVFLVLALFLIVANMSDGIKATQVSSYDTFYVWITGSTIESGLHELESDITIHKLYEDLGVVVPETSKFQLVSDFIAVDDKTPLSAALQIEDGNLPQLDAFPPDLTPLFFRPIPVNVASKATLEQLPGIGDKLSIRIIEYRDEFGVFSKAEDLNEVPGISYSKMKKIKPYIITN